MESLLEHYGDRIRPGDVFIMNDPFDGGMHLQDIFVFKPVHHEGDADRLGGARPRITATSAAGCPGSSACDNTEIFQEGHPAALAQALRRGRAGRGRASRSSRRTSASRA